MMYFFKIKNLEDLKKETKKKKIIKKLLYNKLNTNLF